jgi:hypothetical protein
LQTDKAQSCENETDITYIQIVIICVSLSKLY